MPPITAKLANACPACNFEHGADGEPCENGTQKRCLACGITWREFGDPSSSEIPSFIRMKNPEAVKSKRVDSPEIIEAKVSRSTVNEYKPIHSGRTSMYLSGIAGMAFLFCLAALVFLFQSFKIPQHDIVVTGSVLKAGMQISEVKVSETVRADGKKIFTVSGLLSNAKDVSIPVPQVIVILRDEKGNELTRWLYTAPLKNLDSGSKLRFASSIQYDTPFPVSAEAILQ